MLKRNSPWKIDENEQSNIVQTINPSSNLGVEQQNMPVCLSQNNQTTV